ncbi:hypothetical protein QTP88_014396 [Uroleucon formosanum]
MEYGFVPFINNVTRPSSNTCIDHVFIKTKTRKNVLSIIPHISKNRNNEPNPLTIMKTNEVELTQLIKRQDWLSIYQNKELPTKKDFILHEDTCYANDIKLLFSALLMIPIYLEIIIILEIILYYDKELLVLLLFSMKLPFKFVFFFLLVEMSCNQFLSRLVIINTVPNGPEWVRRAVNSKISQKSTKTLNGYNNMIYRLTGSVMLFMTVLLLSHVLEARS